MDEQRRKTWFGAVMLVGLLATALGAYFLFRPGPSITPDLAMGTVADPPETPGDDPDDKKPSRPSDSPEQDEAQPPTQSRFDAPMSPAEAERRRGPTNQPKGAL
ncbi:MAG: hypothetical protein GY842_09105 [bacterium]|nr:hypothetical protein [bacterium]